ncbi:MAG: PHP domain-containing protein [Halanaerobiales bacterium]|nr:PHP domain-containing protein [Halanaerobiales bacterium]
MSADLHLHTIYSDGSYRPQDVIEMALKVNINTVAISDHDTLKGIEPAFEYAENKNIEVLPAIEFSTYIDKAEIHILGYYIDYKDPKFKKRVGKIFDARKKRAKKMVELLNQEGIEISYEDVKDIAGDDYIGRPHLAQVMVKKGYIENIKDAFTKQYIKNNGKAYVKKYKISPKQAIKLIKDNGGIPVLAHPVFINYGKPMTEKDIKKLQKRGLMGIEVFHPKHDNNTKNYYKKVAKKLNLIITGGSDFHGENSPGVKIGDIRLKNKYVKRLKEAR